jgi:hypothetical protein
MAGKSTCHPTVGDTVRWERSLRFNLDPAAEYLAAISHLIDLKIKSATRTEWQNYLSSLDRIEGYPKDPEGYLTALATCYKACKQEFSLPDLVFSREEPAEPTTLNPTSPPKSPHPHLDGRSALNRKAPHLVRRFTIEIRYAGDHPWKDTAPPKFIELGLSAGLARRIENHLTGTAVALSAYRFDLEITIAWLLAR